MSEFSGKLVSIIVPTCNSGRYLTDCLDSIVCQSYRPIEVIVCDGQSVDATWEIANDFAGRYGFVRPVRQSGQGVSGARNMGMEMASGDYIQFVDSDDRLIPDATACMVHALESRRADVVMAGFRILKSGEERRPAPGYYRNADEFVAERFAESYGYRSNFLNTPWNKMYRRENLTAVFPGDLSLGEDLLFNLEVLRSAEGITVIPEIVYEYNNVNEQSLVHRFREDGFAIETRLHCAVKEFVNGRPELRMVLYENYLYGIKDKLYSLVKCGKKERADIVRELRQWMREPELRELVADRRLFQGRDRVLLFLLKYHLAGCIWFYYRTCA